MSLDDEFDTVGGRIAEAKAVFQPRQKSENPFLHACKPAFRRICGTCKHFPASAGLNAEGQRCAFFDVDVDGDRRAGLCHRWERR